MTTSGVVDARSARGNRATRAGVWDARPVSVDDRGVDTGRASPPGAAAAARVRSEIVLSASTRWLVGIGVAVAAAAVLGVVVALVAGGAQSFPDGSPERAVQQYLEAVGDRDAGAALDFISPALLDECTMPRDAITGRIDYRFRATLDETVTRADDRVDVHVTITESFGDPPFGGGESSWPLVLELTNEEGEWRFTQVPWPLYCVPKAERVPATPVR